MWYGLYANAKALMLCQKKVGICMWCRCPVRVARMAGVGRVPIAPEWLEGAEAPLLPVGALQNQANVAVGSVGEWATC